MAEKIWAFGTKIQRKDPATLTYTDIPGLGDITGPEESSDWLDLTSHDSPNHSEEGIPTVLRHGEIRAPLRFDPSNSIHLALLSDLQTQRKGDWRIVLPDVAVTKLVFQGYVMQLGFNMPVTGALAQNFVLRASGAVSVTTAP